MTRTYRVKKQAGDLKLGDKFIAWAMLKDDVEYKPRRILDIKDKSAFGQEAASRTIVLDDGIRYTFHPEHIVLVEKVA